MKIGILTLPLHTNYGGILQAFALQTTIERMGHEALVINLDRAPRSYSIISVIKHFIILVLSSIKRLKFYPCYNINKAEQKRYGNYLVKTKFTQQFVEKYIHNYWVQNYSSDIEMGNFDAIVVGSDQIWNYARAKAIGGVHNAFLPNLKKDVIRLSYAASFGKDTWEYTEQETAIAKNSIKQFITVSVREKSGIKLCRDYLGVKADQHIDPTMLLSSEDYIKMLALNNVKKSPGNLLEYFIDSSTEKEKIVNHIEKFLSLTKFVVNSKAEDFNSKVQEIEDCIQPPVEKWLRGFVDAEFVVTDSFHACVFSILFNKPFAVVGNQERGIARINSLLEMFDIKGRLINSMADIDFTILSSELPISNIEKILLEERLKSTSYLRCNLGS